MSRLDKDDRMFTNSHVVRSDPKLPAKKFRLWMIAISLILAVGLLTIAVALGIQNHNGRILTAQMARIEGELKATGAKIADIKDHELNTMPDYVKAYAQIEPLLNEYDQKLREYSELCDTAQKRERERHLINVQRLYKRYHPEVCRNAAEIIELIRQINSVMKKEASVIHDMSSFAEKEQVQFWHEEFMPLLAQEHALRERLLLEGQRVSLQPRMQ